MNQDDTETDARPTTWNSDPLENYPVGPDDLGNSVMVGAGFIASGWRWLTSKFRRT